MEKDLESYISSPVRTYIRHGLTGTKEYACAQQARYRNRYRELCRSRCRAYKVAHKKEGHKQKAQWKKDNPQKQKLYERNGALKRKYNLTPRDYEALKEHQFGCCAICRKDASEFAKPLHVDHDHSTQLIRGLLCWKCNALLPHRKNLTELLQRALVYVDSPPAVRAIGARYANKKIKGKWTQCDPDHVSFIDL
jgi:hypothetical protein